MCCTKFFLCNALFSYSSFCSLPNSSSHSSKQVICVLCSLCMKPINIYYEPLNALLLIAYELLLLQKCMLFLAYNWFDQLFWEHMVKKKMSACLIWISVYCIVLFACSGNGEGRKRSLSGCSTDSLTLLPPRRVSWRQKIFLRVASPMNKPSASMQNVGRYICLSVHTDKQTGATLHPVLPAVYL